ncbi:MAG: AMP-binding protein [Candidatus Omnitrophica bacterium]|nr:AMP-binding protein [Candidatus Omnitrophota bacterium]
MIVDGKNVTIIELLTGINQKYGKKTALQMRTKDGFRKLSYSQLGIRTAATASGLIKLGIAKDGRVAILSESRPEWAIAFFGILSAGGICIPLDIKLSSHELELILNHSEAKCVFVSNKYMDIITSIKPKCKKLEYIITLEDTSSQSGVISMAEFKFTEGDLTSREIKEDDAALIIYTSGTTGQAKGVQITYANLLFQVFSFDKILNFHMRGNYLSILPLNHLLELTCGFIGPLYGGATITYCDSLKPADITALMRETKTTVMITVPLLLKMMHNSLMKKLDTSSLATKKMFHVNLAISKFFNKFGVGIVGWLLFYGISRRFGGELRCFICGGAPLDPELEDLFNLIGIPVLQGYGLTETSPVVSVNTFIEHRRASVGKPLADTEVKILFNSESDKEGEIIVKGPNVMKGYFKDLQRTSEVIRDGWFHTGDIGYFDKDGFLYISGRIKNLIVTGAGKKVHPEEVEEQLAKSLYIKEVCVLGRIAQSGIRKGTEEVYAVIAPDYEYVKSKNLPIDDTNVKKLISSEITHFSQGLADYKRVLDFEIWKEEFPRTCSRKIKRKELLELISKPKQDAKEVLAIPELQEDSLDISTVNKLKNILSGLTKIKPDKITYQSNFYNDLGVDSLMKIELICAVEEAFGFDMPDELAYTIGTFQDLVRLVEEYKLGRRDQETIKEEIDIDKLLSKPFYYNITRFLSYTVICSLMKLYFKLEVHGTENLPRTDTFVIAPNHVSLLDFPSIMCALPYGISKNILAPAAKDYFFKGSIKRALIELTFNAFPFDRFGNFLEGLKVCERILKSGKSIILFPEGTRSTKGTLEDFKPGLGMLSTSLKIPIVPTYIEGSYNALPKGKKFPTSCQIKVYFGAPIYPDRYKKSSEELNYELYKKISRDVKLAIIDLMSQSKER